MKTLLLLMALATMARAADRSTNYPAAIIELLNDDRWFSNYTSEIWFSAPAYAFLNENPPLIGRRLCRAVVYACVARLEDAGIPSTRQGVAILDGDRVTLMDPSHFSAEWAVAPPELEPTVYFSSLHPRVDTRKFGSLLPRTGILL